jgi:hypothetical protein
MKDGSDGISRDWGKIDTKKLGYEVNKPKINAINNKIEDILCEVQYCRSINLGDNSNYNSPRNDNNNFSTNTTRNDNNNFSTNTNDISNISRLNISRLNNFQDNFSQNKLKERSASPLEKDPDHNPYDYNYYPEQNSKNSKYSSQLNQSRIRSFTEHAGNGASSARDISNEIRNKIQDLEGKTKELMSNIDSYVPKNNPKKKYYSRNASEFDQQNFRVVENQFSSFANPSEYNSHTSQKYDNQWKPYSNISNFQESNMSNILNNSHNRQRSISQGSLYQVQPDPEENFKYFQDHNDNQGIFFRKKFDKYQYSVKNVINEIYEDRDSLPGNVYSDPSQRDYQFNSNSPFNNNPFNKSKSFSIQDVNSINESPKQQNHESKYSSQNSCGDRYDINGQSEEIQKLIEKYSQYRKN